MFELKRQELRVSQERMSSGSIWTGRSGWCLGWIDLHIVDQEIWVSWTGRSGYVGEIGVMLWPSAWGEHDYIELHARLCRL